MKKFGNLESLLFKVGNYVDGASNLRIVEIWSQGQILTPVDTAAYLPSYIHALKRDLLWVQDERSMSVEWFLNYGETTDDISASATKRSDRVSIEFKENRVCPPTVSIDKQELEATFDSVIQYLERAHA
ncbi:hypothetical protein ACJO5Y_15565 [Marinobacter sp. GN3S48]|uniref:hypothetical protein n=1 Tax=Marinobacter sp. GN3S48 TaxID=3382302 RepID=UPI00387A9297